MKPYGRVAYNGLRFFIKKTFECPGFAASGIQMLGYNTRIQTARNSHVKLGGHTVSDGRLTVIVGSNGSLTVGERVYFNENCMISCKDSVTIGDGCLFGPNVKIFDNDHCYDSQSGVLYQHTTKPITIGEKSWIGANVVILKGSNIGKNCVIGAGCVISGDIPDGSMVKQDRKLIIASIG